MVTQQAQLLADQRKVRADMNFGRHPVEPVYVVKETRKSKACIESLSTCCSMCGKMEVLPTKHQKMTCSISRCTEGFWEGERKWNRLNLLSVRE